MGTINDRRLIRYNNKRIIFEGGGFLDPTRTVWAFEDFIGDHIAEDSTITVNQSGTPLTAAAISATAGAPTAGHGGWIAGKTDDVDAEIDEVALGAKPWMSVARVGNGMMVAEVGFVIPTALTARQYFFGLTDDETEGTTTNGPLNIQTGTTLTSVATDAAGFIYSSLATDNDGWYTASVNADTDGVVTNSGLTGVVDDYTKLRVEIDSSGTAFFYGIVSADGGREITPTNVTGAVNTVATTALLLPYFSAAPTTTTGVEWEIDYLFGAVRG